jgi:PAS domain S-box-containing protein
VVGCHWVAGDGTILWAKRADYEPLGYTQEEYVGHHIAKFHADPDVCDDMWQRLTQGETLYNYRARLRHKNGSVQHVLIASSVLFDVEGHFLHTPAASRCGLRPLSEPPFALAPALHPTAS